MKKSGKLLPAVLAAGLVLTTAVTVCVTALFPSAAISRVNVSDSGNIMAIGKRDYQFLRANCTIAKATNDYTDFTTNISYGANAAGVGVVKNWQEWSTSVPAGTGFFWDARGARKGVNKISGDVFQINFPNGARDRSSYYDVRVTVSDVEFYMLRNVTVSGTKLGKGFQLDLNGSTDETWQNTVLLPIMLDRTYLELSCRSPQYFINGSSTEGFNRYGTIATIKVDIIPRSDGTAAWKTASPVNNGNGRVPMYFSDIDTGYWPSGYNDVISDDTLLYEGIELFPDAMSENKIYTHPSFKSVVDSGRNYVHGMVDFETTVTNEAAFSYIAKTSSRFRFHGTECFSFLFANFSTYRALISRTDTLGSTGGSVSVSINGGIDTSDASRVSLTTFVNDDLSFKVKANSGYYIESIKNGTTDISVTNSAEMTVPYTNITGNVTLSAKIVPYRKIETEVVNGTISDSITGIRNGDDRSVSYSPDTGYHLASVAVNGVPVDINTYKSGYTFSNITADCKIKVVYEIDTFDIMTEAEHGTITPDVRDVPYGDSRTVIYSPDEGHYLESVMVDGNPVSIDTYGNSYTFTNVTADHNIKVVFVPYRHVNVEVVNGTITPSGGYHDIKKGESRTVSYAPNAKHFLSYVEVDGEQVSAASFASSYAFSNIQEDHTVRVVYEPYAKLSVAPRSDSPSVTDGNGLYDFKLLRYEIRDVQGRTVTSFVSDAAGSAMNYDELLPGTYMVVSVNGNGLYREAAEAGSVTLAAGEEAVIIMRHPVVYDSTAIRLDKDWSRSGTD